MVTVLTDTIGQLTMLFNIADSSFTFRVGNAE